MPSTKQDVRAAPEAPDQAAAEDGIESAAFVSVDWEARSGQLPRPDLHTLGLVLSLAALATLFVYDYIVKPEELVWFLHWDLAGVDWLFLTAMLLIVRYGVVPLTSSLEQENKHGRALKLLAAVTGLFALDYLLNLDPLVPVVGWDPRAVDWLIITPILLLAHYIVVPVIRSDDRTAKLARSFLRQPAGAFSLAFLLTFAFAGLVGPDTFFARDYPLLRFRYQPPVFFQFASDKLFYYNCAGQMSNGICSGSWKYPLGTAPFGESMLRVIVQATRLGLELGVTAGMIMAVLATGVGTLAGYYGGLVDDVLMGYVDIQQTVPAIVVYLVLATIFLGNLEGVSDGRMLSLILVFGLLNWGGIARLVRSGVLKRREKGYVRAAKAAGASDTQIIRQHIVPNSKATIVTSLTRQIPLLILAQVALAYLGLNRLEHYSLGRMLRYAHRRYVAGGAQLPWYETWWIAVFPALFLVLTVLAFNLLGDTMRDVLDPQEGVE